jgi:hypothetical protein
MCLSTYQFPEDQNDIREAVHKRFPFLSWTKSITWHQDAFKYTDPKANCPAYKSVHAHLVYGEIGLTGINNFSCMSLGVIIATQS